MKDHAEHKGMDMKASQGQKKSARLGPNEGEVRKVDKKAREITLRHGPLPEVDMSPMTMVFNVKDAALLNTVKTGDRVKFKVEMVDGKVTVTNIQRVQPK
jgi:Cu/Ag efflux protein CusF